MRLLAAMLICLAGLSGSASQVRLSTEPFRHDAYIWQRLWTPQVIAAAQGSADLVRDWHVLLGEADRSGRWIAVSVPWEQVRAIGRPAIGVVRIDGRLDTARVPDLLDRIGTVATRSGLAGIEVDFDCPTSKLATYADFLKALRGRLPRSLPLTITALPTWMESTALDAVVAQADEAVLQVHAVDDPRHGLFDPDRAEQWVRSFGRRTGKPFRVALPAYDVRVTWRSDGRLASVEGEVPVLNEGVTAERLEASPDSVLRFIHEMDRAAPANLAGIVWFRLPTESDRRAWSPETWRAVVSGRLPPIQLAVALAPAEAPGLWTVTLSNEGPVDAPLPRQVMLDAACNAADGANGYRLKTNDGALALEGSGNGRLRAHTSRSIGWARCTDPQRQSHVTQ